MTANNKGREAALSTRAASPEPVWDHSTHQEFFGYYSRESQTERSLGRFRSVRNTILKFLSTYRPVAPALEVADIGCGAGTHSMIWAEAGHSVHALDVNEPLLELGRRRAAEAGYQIDFRIGSATRLPWADSSIDICIGLELIEHVADWQSCINEFVRVLRPGGALFLTTTNCLCPIQEEFRLPLYSWYPGLLKRQFERQACAGRPELANYAKYPAVNWFTFYSLRAHLAVRGLRSFDRFALIDLSNKGAGARSVIRMIRAVPLLRFAAQVCTPGTRILSVKRSA